MTTSIKKIQSLTDLDVAGTPTNTRNRQNSKFVEFQIIHEISKELCLSWAIGLPPISCRPSLTRAMATDIPNLGVTGHHSTNSIAGYCSMKSEKKHCRPSLAGKLLLRQTFRSFFGSRHPILRYRPCNLSFPLLRPQIQRTKSSRILGLGEDDSTTDAGGFVGDGRDHPDVVQDAAAEAGDHGSGSGQARSWTGHGQDRVGDRRSVGRVERLQHGQDPEALDRRRRLQSNRSGPHGQAPSRGHPHGMAEIEDNKDDNFVLLFRSALFLVLMIDRVHHYIRELRIRRKTMEAVKKQNQAFEDGKTAGTDEIKAKEEEITTLQTKLKQLESELETKTKDVHAAEANAVALRKQSEGFLLEYDRLLEENQNLRNRLQTLDRGLSRMGSKKNS
ncbi:hypothetical protein TIFTF001_005951 [Ficus carica]|uniref:Endoplasmic reticulum transmembrane protein n=1 Tax=Ficus carica TaxID=3494 RepID=A0AA88A313_FICCA|nr:hypothetical protein TIFTF001_005951 [Ficus carica]